jgi:hypothetical protein
VFERLYVARRQPDRRETGSGLGLAIVRELVTAMRGQVRASAANGQDGTTTGACLSVFLPFAGSVPPQVSSTSSGCAAIASRSSFIAFCLRARQLSGNDVISFAG